MKVYFKRFISVILAVALVASMLVVPAGASDDGYVYVPDPDHGQIWFDAFFDTISVLASAQGVILNSDFVRYFFTGSLFTHTGRCSSMDQLDAQIDYYNKSLWNIAREIGEYGKSVGNSCIRKYDEENGIFRPWDSLLDCWATDLYGEFPYFEEKFVGGDVPAEVVSPSVQSANKWVDVRGLNLNSLQVVVLTEDSLSETARLINDTGLICTMSKASINGTWYWVIMRSGGTSAAYYCNSAGQPYVAIYEPSATNNQYDYIVGDNAVINDSQIIDLENGTLNLIDETGVKLELEVGSVLLDSGSKIYTVNAYNTTYEGDTAYYTYYTYNITYNITNTYVTYIGSNDAYDREEYEYYYQLPDGRSSADLTADEVAGMSFEFHDVVNYAKSATDTYLRALYHFDGNTDDSSYFSTQGKFEWTEGASITYMEAPSAFDGTLYLDNTAHAFDIVLPSAVGSSDYTIQFRYYQASEPDTEDNIDNFIQIGGTYVLCWDEKTVSRDPNGEYATWALPVGTWNEIALVRNNGWLYIYLNGLCVSSEPYSVPWGDAVSFTLGSGSRAYSMIDEFRVVNFALAENGASYTCTAVPYDTNSVLVLPDSEFPVADEYWDIQSSGDNLLSEYSLDWWDMDHGSSGTFSSYYNDTLYANYYSAATLNYYLNGVRHIETQSSSYNTPSSYPTFNVAPYVTSLSYDPYACLSNGSFIKPMTNSNPTSVHFSGLFTRLYSKSSLYNRDDGTYHLPKGTYSLSMVSVDGNVGTFTFENDYTSYGYVYRGATDIVYDVNSFTFNGYRFSLVYVSVYSPDSPTYALSAYLWIDPLKNAGEFVYLELVEGDSTDLTAEWVTCMYSSEDIKPNTAAIQSDIPVNGYTVGGVRPTFPARGDVWFPVQENRITACYIYTGSMWKEVGCRWYTGSRWIPIYAFDLTTLEDLFDIADAADAVVPITSESAFWRWWQLQWLDFREYLDSKFDALITAIKGGSPGSGDGLGIPDEDGNSEFSLMRLLELVTSSILEIATTVLTEFIGLIADLFKLFIQVVMDFIGGFVGVLSDAAGHIVTLGDRVTPIGDFVRGIYDAIPDDIEAVLTGSFVLVVVVSVMSFLL